MLLVRSISKNCKYATKLHLTSARRQLFEWITQRIRSAHPEPVLPRDGAACVYSWGSASHCQLGHSDADDRHVPTPLPFIEGRVDAVSCGEAHSIAVLNTGRLMTWGWNESGQAGQDEVDDAYQDLEQQTPHVLLALTHKQVAGASCGARHTAVYTADGELFMFGLNERGQLGDGTTYNQFIPTPLQDLRNEKIVQASCGHAHTCSVTADGKLYAWGDRKRYQLGDGTSLGFANFPTLIDVADTAVKLVACGEGHTVVLTCGGEVYVWGLGDLAVPRDSRHGPERVDLGGRRAVQIVCGAAHTLLLTDQGEVLGWGMNNHGQLGTGDTNHRTNPTIIPSLHNIRKVVAGAQHSAAITADGELLIWGCHQNGRLGLGAALYSDVLQPQSVQGGLAGQRVIDAALGHAHSIAVVDRTQHEARS